VPSQPKPLKETKTDPLRVEVEKHMGMSVGIRRLQAFEVLLALDYEDVRKSKDMALAKAYFEEWLAVFEQLCRVEATNPEVEKLKRESVAISEVEVKLSRLCREIRTMLDVLPDRLIHKLVGREAPGIRREL